MNELHNAIALRYKQSVVLNESTGTIRAFQIRGLLLDIAQLGYSLNAPTLKVVRTLTETEFKQFHAMLIQNLKTMIGADVKYNALFTNFPNDIPDDDEYFTRRIFGYITNMFDIVPDNITPLTCGHVIDTRLFNLDEFGACPICQHQVDELSDDESDRPALDMVTPLKLIGLITEDDVKEIFTNLLAAKSSISEDNRLIVAQLVEDDPSMFTYVPAVITMKENAAIIGALAVNYTFDKESTEFNFTEVASDILLNNFKTATDVLRLAVALNNGDVSLKENTKIKLSNSNRHVIMWLLEQIKNPEEDMLRYKMRWIRLAKTIHIGSHAKKYPSAFKACDQLRNKANTIETFNSKIEKLVEIINVKHKFNTKEEQNDLIKLLATRPGEFARRLDWMLRVHSDKEMVLTVFGNLVNTLTTPMLLTLSKHFEHRSEKSKTRYFMPKGNVAKIQVLPDERQTIDSKFCSQVIATITNELLSRFSDLDDLGKVHLSEDLKGYLVPLVQRNATKSLVPIARGSHIPFNESDAIRMFLWWKNNDSRTDVDLSAIIYDSEWNYINHISYTQLSVVGGVHSGDIQDAPSGASEFIDIDLKTARDGNVRYIVMNVISFSGQPFDTFECFAGVMERDKVKSGKKYEPKTVTNKFDLNGDTRYNIPLIIDLETNKIIWADLALSSQPRENVESKSGSVTAMAQSIACMLDDKPNMYDLLNLHITARGELVESDAAEFDTVFDVEMAKNIDEVLAKWL